MGAEMIQITAVAQTTCWPTDEERHFMPALVDGGLLASHACVVASDRFAIQGVFAKASTARRAIVSHEDDNGVLTET